MNFTTLFENRKTACTFVAAVESRKTACAVIAVMILHAASAAAGDKAQSQTGDTPEPSAFEWSLLDRDISSSAGQSVKVGKSGKAAAEEGLSWKRADKPDGSADVSVKQTVVPFWDTRIGADLKVTGNTPSTSSEIISQRATNNGQVSQSNGTAWAAMTAPGFGSIWDKTAVEARVDPAQDQTKVGTSISKSLPLAGDRFSVTVQNGYNVIEQSALPLSGTPRSTRTYEVDHSAKFNVLNTGTSLIAGETFSATDDKWLRKVGAEQKLFGGVSVSGTVSETPIGIPNKTLSAGFKHSW